MAKNLTVGCSEWENAVHEDDHYCCSSALHLGPFLFSILINSVGRKSRRALAGVLYDIREAQAARAEAAFHTGILFVDVRI